MYPNTSGTLGQNATLPGGSCSINLANSSLSPVAGNSDELTLSLAVTFPEQSNGTDFFGTHEVYAWGTNADGLATAAVDLGAVVVSPGQDYTLTVSPSGTTTVPYLGTVTLTVTATALNGFSGQINLQISLAPGLTNPCFGLSGSIPYLTANTQGSFALTNYCQYGGATSQFVITGNAQSIGVSRAGSSSPTLVAAPGQDFTVTPGMPAPSNLPAQGSISYQVTVTSIGGQSGYVNLTLAPPAGGSMPAGVTYQFAPAQVYLTSGGAGQSTLTLSSTAGTPGGTYPLTITGTLQAISAQRTAAFALGTQVTGFQVTSATGSAIVHNTGQEAVVTHSVPASNAPGYATCGSADSDVTCRVISTAPGTVTLGITASPTAVHGTRVLQLNNGAATAHAMIANRSPLGVSVSPSRARAGQWSSATVTITGLDESYEFVESPISCVDVAFINSLGVPVGWAYLYAGTDYMLMLAPPLDSAGSYDIGADLCGCDFNPGLGPGNCQVYSGPVTVDPAPPPPPTLSCTPITNGTPTVTRGGTLTCTVSGTATANISSWQFTGGGATVNGPGGTLTWSGIMVVSGTVKAALSSGSSLQQAVTVNARTNFAFAAVTATKRPNPYSGGACDISVPSSPAAGNDLGYYCLGQQFSETPYLIGDSGPNNGYRYVYAATNSSSSGQTAYNYVIAGYLDDSAGQFAQMQCANYNAVTNTGFISYAQLKSNTYEHESGNTTGHYAQYTSAQGASGNNVGVAMEAVVGPPGQSEADFNSAALATAAAKANVIKTASDAEACNQDVRYDTSCVFRGFINWPVYASCQ